MRPLKSLALAASTAVLFAFSIPAPAAVFSVQTIACTVDNTFNSDSPVTSAGLCDPGFGSSAAQAFATFGSVGARAEGNTLGQNLSLLGGEGFASYSDVVRLTKTDPTASDIVAVSLNLAFDGGFLATNAPGSGAEARYGFSVATPGGTFRGNGIFNTSLGFSVTPSGLGDDVRGPGLFSFNLVTPDFQVDFANQKFADFEIAFDVSAAAAAFGLANAVSDFGRTLEFPAGGAVFNLPAGYTANAGAYLVDNRFVDPNATAVPEPATWALLLTGFGMLGVTLSRRRGAQERRAA